MSECKSLNVRQNYVPKKLKLPQDYCYYDRHGKKVIKCINQSVKLTTELPFEMTVQVKKCKNKKKKLFIPQP